LSGIVPIDDFLRKYKSHKTIKRNRNWLINSLLSPVRSWNCCLIVDLIPLMKFKFFRNRVRNEIRHTLVKKISDMARPSRKFNKRWNVVGILGMNCTLIALGFGFISSLSLSSFPATNEKWLDGSVLCLLGYLVAQIEYVLGNWIGVRSELVRDDQVLVRDDIVGLFYCVSLWPKDHEHRFLLSSRIKLSGKL
jgi:hypothetical protein